MVDRSVDTTTAEKRLVRGVDDASDLEAGDVSLPERDLGVDLVVDLVVGRGGLGLVIGGLLRGLVALPLGPIEAVVLLVGIGVGVAARG